MKEKPIIFSGPMVRAIRSDRKTNTRRLLKPQPHDMGEEWFWTPHATQTGMSSVWSDQELRIGASLRCPYGGPEDMLWVKEPWRTEAQYDDLPPRDIVYIEAEVVYEADGQVGTSGRYRHARYMPRRFSRITLEVTGVRVERVAEISEEGAVAEGFERREHFARYWDAIHGPVAFDRNAWVWVVEFQRRDGLTVERVR